jgi:hypothetical protein
VLPVALYDGAKVILSVVNSDRRDGCFAGALLGRSVGSIAGLAIRQKAFGVN